jgi:DNA invertase Pin-like site-specific DNA recombinase
MDQPFKKLFRCAVYTRKSTEYNLDLEFNSLDAQREACEAYIKSQAPEGWRLIPTRYDDGAFSGASLDRPALQELLAEVRSGKLDVIVVYKVDRLTRSLADFAKLIELFERHSVSFVSVTQSFNTTSSMGRLTLNVLLSFAQFEREVIGERVRDKIAASKRKGIWVGGSVPLGYASINKRLTVVPEEAETVRLIFQRYLELGSIRTLIEDLDRRGIRTRRQTLSNGQTRGGIRFGVGALAHLLQNRFYIGEIVYRGGVHVGEQEAIVDRALFEAVQAKLAARAANRRLRTKGSPALLAGRIFDDHGNCMTPSHTRKRGVRYRYYVSHALLQHRGEEAGSVSRVPAHEIENAVLMAIRAHLHQDESPEPQTPEADRDLLERWIRRVVVKRQEIQIELVQQIADPNGEALDPSAPPFESNLQPLLTVPWTAAAGTAAKGVLDSPAMRPAAAPPNGDALLSAIAKARAWVSELVDGRAASFAEIAEREGKAERYIRFLAPLAFVSPRIVHSIANGSLRADLNVTKLVKLIDCAWTEQERCIFFTFGAAKSRVRTIRQRPLSPSVDASM